MRRPQAGRRRWWLPLLGLGLLLAVGAAVLALRAGEPGGGVPQGGLEAERTPAPLPPPVSAPLDPEGSELVKLLAAGRSRTFHAVYEASGPELGGKLTLELFRKDGKLRQDSRLESEAGVALTAGFVLGDDTTILCTKRSADPWVCARSAGSAEPAVDGVFGSIAGQLAGVDTSAEDATVAGRQARCFTFPTGDGPGSLCVTRDGIPVRATVNGTKMTLVSLSESVDDDRFTPPAEPVKAEG